MKFTNFNDRRIIPIISGYSYNFIFDVNNDAYAFTDNSPVIFISSKKFWLKSRAARTLNKSKSWRMEGIVDRFILKDFRKQNEIKVVISPLLDGEGFIELCPITCAI